MATEAVFPVLIAADGSSTARAAVMTTLMFPWPDKTEVHGVVEGSRVVQRPFYRPKLLPIMLARWLVGTTKEVPK